MNANTQDERGAASLADASSTTSVPLQRARLYHFFELALAHPGEDGIDYFRQPQTEEVFLGACSDLLVGKEGLKDKGGQMAKAFFSELRKLDYEDVESAHIGLFSSNFPHLPCPPYGSLFTAPDANKRLDEMLAIKDFYHRNGVDIADSFTDLPDHLCVELEFAQLLCFRENDAIISSDADVQGGVRRAQAEFLDRFLVPLGTRLAELSAASMPENPYRYLLEAMHCFLLAHRESLGVISESSQQNQGRPS